MASSTCLRRIHGATLSPQTHCDGKSAPRSHLRKVKVSSAILRDSHNSFLVSTVERRLYQALVFADHLI